MSNAIYDIIRDAVYSPNVDHVNCAAYTLPNAKVLWQNSSVGDESSVLHDCALTLNEAEGAVYKCSAVADRYGGNGIGRNGGSGRNIYVKQLQIKGAGRTPLVHPSTPLSHASGGAYLEECVRETIFSLVVAHDFPYGSIPVNAILDTGLTVQWPAGIWPQMERRCLLIRPAFARPAHFERALGFGGESGSEGYKDAKRVATIFENLKCSVGLAGIRDMLMNFWLRWCHQLAYGFVHRLVHGNDTTSNISIDGALVDFGATTAVPDWGVVATSFAYEYFQFRVEPVVRSVKTTQYYLAKYCSAESFADHEVPVIQACCRVQFKRFVLFEVLRLCGVDDFTAADAVRRKFKDYWPEVDRIIGKAQNSSCDMDFCNSAGSGWQFHKVWDCRKSHQLFRLGKIIRRLVAAADHHASYEKCKSLSRSRPLLQKSKIRQDFFDAIASEDVPNLGATQEFVRSFIAQRVCDGIRESTARYDIEAARPQFAWSYES